MPLWESGTPVLIGTFSTRYAGRENILAVCPGLLEACAVTAPESSNAVGHGEGVDRPCYKSGSPKEHGSSER